MMGGLFGWCQQCLLWQCWGCGSQICLSQAMTAVFFNRDELSIKKKDQKKKKGFYFWTPNIGLHLWMAVNISREQQNSFCFWRLSLLNIPALLLLSPKPLNMLLHGFYSVVLFLMSRQRLPWIYVSLNEA